MQRCGSCVLTRKALKVQALLHLLAAQGAQLVRGQFAGEALVGQRDDTCALQQAGTSSAW
jgi:hypothetical protein